MRPSLIRHLIIIKQDGWLTQHKQRYTDKVDTPHRTTAAARLGGHSNVLLDVAASTQIATCHGVCFIAWAVWRKPRATATSCVRHTLYEMPVAF